jgi:hypothetical protein
MALIKCPECNGDVSDKANTCPHCGNPIYKGALPVKEVPPLIPKENDVVKKLPAISIKRVLYMVLIGVCALGLLVAVYFEVPSAAAFVERVTTPILSSLPTVQSVRNFIYDKVFRSKNEVVVDVGKALWPPQKTTTTVEAGSLAVQTNSVGTKTYPFERIDLWGYTFYTSKIDGGGSVDIGSQNKQTIGKLLVSLSFPPDLTNSLGIVAADPTLMKSGDQFQVPWLGTMQIPLAFQPEGGLYTQIGSGALIFLNGGYDLSVLTHELGHQIGSHMTDQEWSQYYKLRGISASAPRRSGNWNLSPEEDFAEVYRTTYGQGGPIQTHYGLLMASNDSSYSDFISSCSDEYNQAQQDYIKAHSTSSPYSFSLPSSDMLKKAEEAANSSPVVQVCRRDNNKASPFGGVLYTYQVSPATKQFIQNIVTSLKQGVSRDAQTRNAQRVSNIMTILNAINQRMADNRGLFETGCSAGVIPTSMKQMGSGYGNYNIEPCIVPTYLSAMPVDPVNGKLSATGYSISINAATGQITITANNAELSASISVRR